MGEEAVSSLATAALSKFTPSLVIALQVVVGRKALVFIRLLGEAVWEVAAFWILL